jgi:vacuolar-type H+-ATPase subunit H
MTSDPAQIQRDIDHTRASLSADVDALNEKVNPRYAVQRSKSRFRGRLQRAKGSVMGSVPSGDRVSSSASDTASQATDTVVHRTEGNPLAAGLVAFGVGWLASSLLPSTEAERQAGQQLKQRAQDSGVVDSVKEEARTVAHDTAEQMRQPAQEAADSVRSTAQDAAGEVRGEAQSAGQDVAGQARDSGEQVRRQA